MLSSVLSRAAPWAKPDLDAVKRVLILFRRVVLFQDAQQAHGHIAQVVAQEVEGKMSGDQW